MFQNRLATHAYVSGRTRTFSWFLAAVLLLMVHQSGHALNLAKGGPPSKQTSKPTKKPKANVPPPDSSAGPGVFVSSYSLVRSANSPIITVSLDPASGAHQMPTYVLLNQVPRTVHVVSDSSIRIRLAVKTGGARVSKQSDSTFTITPVQTGSLVLEASQEISPGKTSSVYTSVSPVDMNLMVAQDLRDAGRLHICDILFPSVTASPMPVDAATLISVVGDTRPFTLKAVGRDTIFIYQSTSSNSAKTKALTVDAVKNKLSQLQATIPPDAMGARPFSIELSIRHAAALGDLAARLGSINPAIFSVKDVGSDRIRISSAEEPDCDTWKTFLSDARHVVFGITPEAADARLFYLSAADVSTAFGTGSPNATATPTGGDNETTPAATTVKGESGASTKADGTGSIGSGSVGKGTSKSAAKKPVTGGGAAVTSKGSDEVDSGNSKTTVTMDAGKTVITAENNAQTPSTDSETATKASDKSAGPTEQPAASNAKRALTIAPLGSDTLLFSDANAGDDSVLTEKKRFLAQLDLPRPEMIINAWVMQNSTGDPATAGRFTSLVRHLVNQHNDALQQTIFLGYKSLKDRIKADPTAFFDTSFYNYVTQRYIATDPYRLDDSSSIGSRAEQYLAGDASLTPDTDLHGQPYGACSADSYCLGYSRVFQPLKPRLTDLLLAIIASKAPAATATAAITAAEDRPDPNRYECSPPQFKPDKARSCKALFRNVDMAYASKRSDEKSIVCDRKDIYKEIEIAGDSYVSQIVPKVQLECFAETVSLLLTPPKWACYVQPLEIFYLIIK